MKTQLYNLDVLRMTTDGDIDFFIKILDTFLLNNKDLLEKMKSCTKSRNLIDVGNFAHKMLSSYKHLEVNLLIDVLTKLETLSLGHVIGIKDVEEMVAYLAHHSDKLFSEIENEIQLAKKQRP